MQILLIGMVACGRSSVGMQLAQELGYTFVEMDEEILKLSRQESFDEWVTTAPVVFHEIQMQVARSLASLDAQVIASSGSIVEDKINIEFFRQLGAVQIVYLETSCEEIVRRLIARGSIDKTMRQEVSEKLNAIFDYRHTLYQYFADIVVHTEDREIDEIVQEILRRSGSL